jgi:hypothetical protein
VADARATQAPLLVLAGGADTAITQSPVLALAGGSGGVAVTQAPLLALASIPTLSIRATAGALLTLAGDMADIRNTQTALLALARHVNCLTRWAQCWKITTVKPRIIDNEISDEEQVTYQNTTVAPDWITESADPRRPDFIEDYVEPYSYSYYHSSSGNTVWHSTLAGAIADAVADDHNPAAFENLVGFSVTPAGQINTVHGLDPDYSDDLSGRIHRSCLQLRRRQYRFLHQRWGRMESCI